MNHVFFRVGQSFLLIAALLLLNTSFAATSELGFYFDPQAGVTDKSQFFADEPRRSGICDIPITNQTTRPPLCPNPPKQKNGKNCFAGTIPSFDRHADGYEEYITNQILSAVEQTQMFNVEGVSPVLLFSIMAKESFFNPMSYNRWKDMGIAQFQLGTANETLRYMKSIGIDVPSEATGKTPPNCQRNKYSSPLTKACFKSIKANCTKPAYANSLFCPNFAVRLMAFHLLQVQERDVNVEIKGKRHSLVPLLVPTDDHEARLRHILSVYNRGYRIYTSAVHNFKQENGWTPASHYGKIWSQNRVHSNGKDPFPGGTLKGHYINRCYVWAIGGLCGGMKKSVIAQFQKRLCNNKVPDEVEKLSRRSYQAFSQRQYSEALRFLQSELTRRRVYTRNEILSRVRIALNILEDGSDRDKEKVYEILNYAMTKAGGDQALKTYLKAQMKAVKVDLSTFNEAYAFYERLKKDRFVGSFEKNAQRLAGFFALKSQSWKTWSATKSDARLHWLFLSGASGYYFFGSGLTELRQYVDLCLASEVRNQPVCRFTNEAKKYLMMAFVGQTEKWARPAE